MITTFINEQCFLICMHFYKILYSIISRFSILSTYINTISMDINILLAKCYNIQRSIEI